MTSYDAVVAGGGHNGLVCAIRLAQSGRRVVVHLLPGLETG